MTKIVTPLAWNPTMDCLEKVLRDFPEDRRGLFRAGLTDGTLSPNDSHEGATPMRDEHNQGRLRALSQLLGEHGKRPDKWRIIAEELNRRGFKSPTGKVWTNDGARKFCNRNADRLESFDKAKAPEPAPAEVIVPTTEWVIDSPETPHAIFPDPTHTMGTQATMQQPYEATLQDPSGEAVARTLPTWLDTAAWEDLRLMLDSWRSRKERPVLPQRPIFKGQRRNTGVHCNTEILERAAAKAKAERLETGGSLSMLVELLLWRYIGEPEDLLDL